MTFHKCLSSSAVNQVNYQLREWQQPYEQAFIVVEQSRKRYLDHYRALIHSHHINQVDAATLPT